MATIYSTLLGRGYFPKELPPDFSTELFAAYATTRRGRSVLDKYRPSANFTACADYQLALPGHIRRPLALAHPGGFSKLAYLSAKNFRRLLKKVGRSPFSRSRPVYEADHLRAIRPLFRPGSLNRERASIRAGASFLVQADVSQFYPSLYTHAVGWAIDPKLRKRQNWNNRQLLGKKLDQGLMDVQGKSSQGVPIGPDISFLLAETVLAAVDRQLKLSKDRAYRWFDDYEIACASQGEAERVLAQLGRALADFNLRLNPVKSRISRLPLAIGSSWRDALIQRSRSGLQSAHDIVAFFDEAFRWREQVPNEPVLLYALGLLFKLSVPPEEGARPAISGLTQCVLAEPGCAQKAFSLLSYWTLNGFEPDKELIARTVDQIVLNHEATGLSSDVCWALFFCLEHEISLSRRSGRVLSSFDNDCVMLQALDMNDRGLLASGFTATRIRKGLGSADLDGEHWLIAYEACRHGFLSDSRPAVLANALFSDLLAKGVTFYRGRSLPDYAMVIHPGGAPEWVVARWLLEPDEERDEKILVAQRVGEDLEALLEKPENSDEALLRLLRRLQSADFELVAVDEGYSS